MSLERPRLPPDFDDSRASERSRDPSALRFGEAERRGVFRAMKSSGGMFGVAAPTSIGDELLEPVTGGGSSLSAVGWTDAAVAVRRSDARKPRQRCRGSPPASG